MEKHFVGEGIKSGSSGGDYIKHINITPHEIAGGGRD
ncbi:unnamed protein product [Brassica oleracea]